MAGLLGRLWGGARSAARAGRSAVRTGGLAARRGVTGVGRGIGQAGSFAANHYWTIDSILSKLNNLVDSFTHVITVQVVGGPAADLRRVYYLACAAAFGRYSRAVTRVNGSYFEMACSADVTDKSVTITIAYNVGLLGDTVRALGGGRTPLNVMFDGPDQVTIGRGWTAPFFTTKGIGSRYANVTPGTVIRGGGVKTVTLETEYDTPQGILVSGGGRTLRIDLGRNVWQVDQVDELRKRLIPLAIFQPAALQPATVDVLRELEVVPSQSSDGRRLFYLRRVVPTNRYAFTIVQTDNFSSVPILPDDGRLITTGEVNDSRVQPPRPPVDGFTRGTLLALTVQALTDPGYLPRLPPLTTVPLGTGGFYLNAPGETAPGGQPGDQALPGNNLVPPPVVKFPVKVPFGGIIYINGVPESPQRPPAPLLRDPRTVRPRPDLV